jgi:hypothetical protein
VSAPSPEVSASPLSQASHAPDSYSIVRGSLDSGSLASLSADDGSRLVVGSVKVSNRHRTEHYASVTIPGSQLATLSRLQVRHDGHVSAGTLALRVFNWRTGAWTTVDGPRTVSSDLTVTWVTTSRDYVSSTGVVRIGAVGERKSGFQARSDLFQVVVDY